MRLVCLKLAKDNLNILLFLTICAKILNNKFSMLIFVSPKGIYHFFLHAVALKLQASENRPGGVT